MYNFIYFSINNTSTIDEVKKQYKKLAFQFHPDIAKNDGEAMKTINNEYEIALKEIGKAQHKSYSLDADFINIIDALIKLQMKNVEIEITGFFIWISGDTKPYCKYLGKQGLNLLWHNTKKSWYYKPSWYYNKSPKQWSMDNIRECYGSQKVNNNNSYDNMDNFAIAN